MSIKILLYTSGITGKKYESDGYDYMIGDVGHKNKKEQEKKNIMYIKKAIKQGIKEFACEVKEY